MQTHLDIWLEYYRSWRSEGYSITDSVREADTSLLFYKELSNFVIHGEGE